MPLARRLSLPVRLLLLLACAALPAGCGGASPKDLNDRAYSAFSTGDYATAMSLFEDAAAAMPADDPLRLAVDLGILRTKAHLEPEAGASEFLTFAQGNGALKESDYRQMATDLFEEDRFKLAAGVLAAAKERWAESTKFQALIDRVGDAANKAGDTETVNGLEGLGYVGND